MVQAFWRAAGLSGEAITIGGKSVINGCARGPLCIVFDATSANGNPALVSFIAGQQQLQYANIPVCNVTGLTGTVTFTFKKILITV